MLIMQRSTVFFVMVGGILMILNFPGTEARMTLPQLTNALKGMAKTCVSKTGVTEEVLAQTKQGEFPPDRALQCYHLCLLTQMKVAKDGNILIEVMKKTIDMTMQKDLVPRTKEVVQACYDSITSDDNCEQSWEFTKCYYNTDPSVVGRMRSRLARDGRKFESGRCKRRRGTPSCTGFVETRRRQDNSANESYIGPMHHRQATEATGISYRQRIRARRNVHYRLT